MPEARVPSEHGENADAWSHPSSALEKPFNLLGRQESLRHYVRERQKYEELPDVAWQMMGELSLQLQELRKQVQAQNREIAELKGRPSTLAQRPVAAPDALQRWRVANRTELAKYRGRHVAINPAVGILAEAENYARLVEELEARGIPDDETVIEFVPSYFQAK